MTLNKLKMIKFNHISLGYFSLQFLTEGGEAFLK